MSAPTVAVEWLLARAAVRSTGLLHVVSRRDSGALNPVCGANPIRSREIETHSTVPADVPVCADCTAFTARWGGVDAFLNDYIGRFFEAPIAAIDLRQDHARREPGDLTELVASIRTRGVVAPVIVTRVGDRFEIIDGARRVAASHLAGRATVPAILSEATDSGVLLDSLVANLHRADLNPIDQAHAYQHALTALGIESKAELGRLLGISREQISNTIRLLALPDEDQARIAAGDLTAADGRKLLAAPKPPAAKLDDVSALLAHLLTAKVAVTARGGRTRIVIDVADDDAPRVLAQLGETAVAA